MLAWIPTGGWPRAPMAHRTDLDVRLAFGKRVLRRSRATNTTLRSATSAERPHRPRTAILSTEYDHADIFPDLAAIETQFHHLVRTIPRTGH
jgi:UDP-N-acetylmuramate: L-alanyl-gamma-D-glutamyl-meso-diaminopimelate ligase